MTGLATFELTQWLPSATQRQEKNPDQPQQQYWETQMQQRRETDEDLLLSLHK